MKIGLIGLGKMGFHLALNLRDHGHEVVGFDLSDQARKRLEEENVATASDLPALLAALPAPKVLWMMVPSGQATEASIQEAKALLSEGDILIDAGNSNYKDSMRHGAELAAQGIRFLDVGTSGGMSGARNGACLMIGGDPSAYEYLEEAFQDVAVKKGCVYTGKAGSGHFMKMVHNGIEYGMMQAIGEGFQIMRESPFDYDLADVAENWNHGSVIRGWLMALAEEQFRAHPDLSDLRGVVAASGEAKWTVEAALELGIAAPTIALSLFMRNLSQEEDSFSAKVVAALRNGFGGHAMVKKEDA